MEPKHKAGASNGLGLVRIYAPQDSLLLSLIEKHGGPKNWSVIAQVCRTPAGLSNGSAQGTPYLCLLPYGPCVTAQEHAQACKKMGLTVRSAKSCRLRWVERPGMQGAKSCAGSCHE